MQRVYNKKKEKKEIALEAFMEEMGVEFDLDGSWQYLKGLSEVEKVFYNVNLYLKTILLVAPRTSDK